MARNDTGLAARLDHFLASQGSPMAGLGSKIVHYADQNHIDPRLLVAISGAETSFGTDPNAGQDPAHHNVWGWGPHHRFRSWDEALSTIASGLRHNYLDQGYDTIAKISTKWAPVGASNDPTGLNVNWTDAVSHFYGELGGHGFPDEDFQPVQGVGPEPLGQPPDRGQLTPLTIAQPPAQPDFASAALANLQDISRGDYDPIEGTTRLADAYQMALQAPQRTIQIEQPSSTTPAVSDYTQGPQAPGSTPDFSPDWLEPGYDVKGFPGEGTHDWNKAPNNWQSDNAIDIYMPIGTPIYAPASGKLGNTGYLGDPSDTGRFAGQRTNLYTDDGQGFYFAHLSKLAPGIEAGAHVKAGQLIGWSGEANGVQHLHFAVEKGDPRQYYQSPDRAT